MKMNNVRVTAPPAVATAWESVLPGQWFNERPTMSMFPMMKIETGGYVSPANGHVCTPESVHFKEVYVVPDGTEITLEVGKRLQ